MLRNGLSVGLAVGLVLVEDAGIIDQNVQATVADNLRDLEEGGSDFVDCQWVPYLVDGLLDGLITGDIHLDDMESRVVDLLQLLG